MDIFNIETLGEAMRPENLRGEAFRLSREERDHVAGHALDSIKLQASELVSRIEGDAPYACSVAARKIAALSNLLGDIGWEREAVQDPDESMKTATPWVLGELFPVAQLRPWLEEWQRQDNDALRQSEELLELADVDSSMSQEAIRERVSDAQTKLGTGAILLARIEKWMACKEN